MAWQVKGEDVALEQDDVGPAAESGQSGSADTTKGAEADDYLAQFAKPFPSDEEMLEPWQKQTAEDEAAWREQLESLTDADAPPVRNRQTKQTHPDDAMISRR